MSFIQAAGMGGTITPRLIVIHSMEAPLRAGVARSIANMFHTHAATSAHWCVGPDEVIQCVPETRKAWHVGPNANAYTVGIEQTGYAAFSRADWTTPTGLAQLANLAALASAMADRLGIPKRWASDAEIRAACKGSGKPGFCTHADITRLVGGTSHTDPGTGYPRDLLMAAINGQGAGMSAQEVWQFPTNKGIWAQSRLEGIDDKTGHIDAMVSGGIFGIQLGGPSGTNTFGNKVTEIYERALHGVPLSDDAVAKIKSAVSVPALTDAQVQALTAQLIPALTAQLVQPIADAVLAAYKKQLTK